MCACEPGYTCSQCVGTPFDPHYQDDAHEPMDTAEFDELTRGPGTVEWQGWV